MSLSYSAALKRAAGQNKLKKKGGGRKEDGSNAELEHKAVFFFFFLEGGGWLPREETLKDRTGSGVGIKVQTNQPERSIHCI